MLVTRSRTERPRDLYYSLVLVSGGLHKVEGDAGKGCIRCERVWVCVKCGRPQPLVVGASTL